MNVRVCSTWLLLPSYKAFQLSLDINFPKNKDETLLFMSEESCLTNLVTTAGSKMMTRIILVICFIL
jgi:hypothetical protein